MKNLVKICSKFLIVLIMLLGVSSIAFGQPTQPIKTLTAAEATVEIGSTTYSAHGYNKDGVADPTRENTEYVTVGSVLQYFVMPDPIANPGFNVTNPTQNVASSFEWSVSGTGGTVTATTPLATVTWGNTPGSFLLTAIEKPATNLGFCDPASNPGTIVDVVVIPKTRIGFTTGDGAGPEITPLATAYTGYICEPTNPATTAKTVSFTMALPVKDANTDNIWVSYTITGTTPEGQAITGLTQGTDVPLTLDATLDLIFNAYGKYVITLTKVTDRISRKPATEVPGELLASGAGLSFTFDLTKPVETGPIYRLPNHY